MAAYAPLGLGYPPTEQAPSGSTQPNRSPSGDLLFSGNSPIAGSRSMSAQSPVSATTSDANAPVAEALTDYSSTSTYFHPSAAFSLPDPVAGQAVCSYGSAQLTLPGYTRIPPVVPIGGVYGTSYTSSEPSHYTSIGLDSTGALHSSLGNTYALKGGAVSSELSSWTPTGIQPTAGFYPYDSSVAAYGYGAGYDLASRRKNATRESTATLKTWLNEHKKNPYPTKGEKIMLAIITKMTLTQVSTWFANARRRLKKENKMTCEPKGRAEEDVDAAASDEEHDRGQEERGMGSVSGTGPTVIGTGATGQDGVGVDPRVGVGADDFEEQPRGCLRLGAEVDEGPHNRRCNFEDSRAHSGRHHLNAYKDNYPPDAHLPCGYENLASQQQSARTTFVATLSIHADEVKYIQTPECSFGVSQESQDVAPLPPPTPRPTSTTSAESIVRHLSQCCT